MTHSSSHSDLEPLTSELARLVERAAPRDGMHPLLPFAWAFRASGPTPPSPTVYTPVLCVMAQGRKQILVGEDRFIYDTDHFFLASVTVPVAGQVLDATPARPCLSLAIALEPALISSVVAEAGFAATQSHAVAARARLVPHDRASARCRRASGARMSLARRQFCGDAGAPRNRLSSAVRAASRATAPNRRARRRDRTSGSGFGVAAPKLRAAAFDSGSGASLRHERLGAAPTIQAINRDDAAAIPKNSCAYKKRGA